MTEEQKEQLERNLEAGELAMSLGVSACPQCGSTIRGGLLGGCDFPTHPWHDEKE